MLVIDHSGSMRGYINNTNQQTKMDAAKQSAILAIKTMLPGDYLGVIQFEFQPEWVLNLGPNHGRRGGREDDRAGRRDGYLSRVG